MRVLGTPVRQGAGGLPVAGVEDAETTPWSVRDCVAKDIKCIGPEIKILERVY